MDIPVDSLIKTFAHRYGISLKEKHLSQLSQIINHRAQLHTNGDRKQYIENFLKDDSYPEWEYLIDQFTIQETYFFRNKRQFAYLKNHIIPELMEKKGKWSWQNSGFALPQIRILSAACSTGEEPYSIGITFAEAIEYIRGWDIKIDAFDINSKAIRKAKSGKYHPTERFKSSLKEINPNYLQKYFVFSSDGDYIIKKDIQDIVRFRQMNIKDLFDRPQLLLAKYDIIFCRNVMIYFDFNDQAMLVRTLEDSLVPGGYLMMGDAEALHLYPHTLVMVNSTQGLIYQKESN